MSSIAEWAGVMSRSPAFWSHALVSQSAASAAGWVPPITNPKNRPDGMAVSPGSHAPASRSTTSTASSGPSGSAAPSAAFTSSIDAVAGTPRSSSEASQARACACARSRAAGCSSIPAVWPDPVPATSARRLVSVVVEVLDEATWRARAEAHAARVDAFVAPHLARRGSAVKHPVHDFLFTYYSQRPAQLRRWHPGFGVALEGAEEYAGSKGYSAADLGAPGSRYTPSSLAGTRPPHTRRATRPTSWTVSPEYVEAQRPLVESLHRLLTATAARPANFGCFGLHEWAMVYRLDEDETRHADWPLRLGPAGTDAVVESHRIGCSHFDAFRFFTPPARSLNVLSPGRDDRAAYEQPACLHGNMDLYKHAFRLTPMVSSDLVADCFELARDIRELDMRAAPYDLVDLGFEPVRIETPQGKQEYAAAQRGFAERAGPLRDRLIAACHRLAKVSLT